MPLPLASTVRSLALPALGGGDDDRLDLLIATADAVCADLCLFPRTTAGTKTLESAQYGQSYDRPDRDDPRRLTLGLRPVEVTSLRVDTDGDWTWSTAADLESDVLTDRYRGVVRINPTSTFSFLTGSYAIQVQATAGWDVSAERPLVEALALLVGHWVAVGQAGTLVQQATAGGSSVGFRDPGIPPAVVSLLRPYTLWEREGLFRGQR